MLLLETSCGRAQSPAAARTDGHHACQPDNCHKGFLYSYACLACLLSTVTVKLCFLVRVRLGAISEIQMVDIRLSLSPALFSHPPVPRRKDTPELAAPAWAGERKSCQQTKCRLFAHVRVAAWLMSPNEHIKEPCFISPPVFQAVPLLLTESRLAFPMA